jgi:ribosome biogenesis GTPase
LGLTPHFEAAFRALNIDGGVPARVVASHGRLCRVLTETGELMAEVGGQRRDLEPTTPGRPTPVLPVTGDFVVVRPLGDGRALVQAVLPRQTAFSRKAAGEKTVAQVVAANVDVVFLVLGLDGDFSPRRLERYLVLAWESGARPVVVLNKTDMCDDLEGRLQEIAAVACGTDVHAVSALTGAGLEALQPELRPGRTIALLGSSGAGKSTLINRLAGQELRATQPVRERDQRGKHTTTARELVPLESGAWLLDTPGMRELQLWAGEDALDAVFDDVTAVAAQCRFGDCSHRSEPGCAVREALESGSLAPERVRSQEKLKKEIRHLELRQDQGLRLADKARVKTIHRQMRHFKKGF